MFLHEAVAEALYLRVTPVKANEYEAYYKSLLQYDRDTGNTGLEQQFQVRIKSIFHGCMVWIEKSVTRVTDRHHETCRVMPISDPE